MAVKAFCVLNIVVMNRAGVDARAIRDNVEAADSAGKAISKLRSITGGTVVVAFEALLAIQVEADGRTRVQACSKRGDEFSGAFAGETVIGVEATARQTVFMAVWVRKRKYLRTHRLK